MIASRQQIEDNNAQWSMNNESRNITVLCNSRRARNAALGCGAVGAGIGAYMDAQEVELREQLQGTGVQVRRDGDQLDLIMPGNITFNTDDLTIRPGFHSVLDSVPQVLYKYVDTRLISQGMGRDRPIASNDSDSGRSMNRRVELQIVAITN